RPRGRPAPGPAGPRPRPRAPWRSVYESCPVDPRASAASRSDRSEPLDTTFGAGAGQPTGAPFRSRPAARWRAAVKRRTLRGFSARACMTTPTDTEAIRPAAPAAAARAAAALPVAPSVTLLLSLVLATAL